MKSYTFVNTLLGSIGMVSAAEYAAMDMDMDTFCITIAGPGTVDQTSAISESARMSAVSSESSSLDIAPTEAQTSSGDLSSGLTTGSLTNIILTSLMSTDSAAFPTSSGIVEPPGRSVIFLIQQESDNQKRDIKKRATGGFVGANNPDICTFASVFNLAEGRLFSGGLPIFYDSGEEFKVLDGQSGGSLTSSSITRTFETIDQALVFRNSGLPNGQAGFCQVSSGQVYVTFGTQPLGCEPVTLVVYDIEQCQDGRLDTSTTSGTVSETSTTEEASSGSPSSEESMTAETTVPTESNSPSSSQADPSVSSSETSGFGGFSTTPTEVVTSSASTSSQASSSEVSSTISSEVSFSSALTQSPILSSESSTEASSSTRSEVSSSLTNTSAGSTLQSSSESIVPASSSTSPSSEETTASTSAETSESSSEIETSTTEGITTTGPDTTTAETTTDLTTTTSAAPDPSSCAALSNPYTDSGSSFDLECSFTVTSGTSIGNVQANSFQQCVFFCAQASNCAAISYTKSSMNCQGFSSFSGTTANNLFDVAIKRVATTTTATV
ncbi:hypothetical protein F53441_7603 [Fusarium austroafricanum]|uniref:Apple domain-containing protein n=1 Tax=Fusarium austroafricanum TaxID=2364996 RepID=A0A8H4KG07_9HYPO|nr:hypothetical protein F53441_7603 [Fusarium austroafricanum]